MEDSDGSLQRSHHGHSGLGLHGAKDAVMGHVEGHEALAEAVKVTREADIFERLLHYRRPVARCVWNRAEGRGVSEKVLIGGSGSCSACSHTSAGKRVLLVGDAAHGMHPR